jgi:hypothetical protein
MIEKVGLQILAEIELDKQCYVRLLLSVISKIVMLLFHQVLSSALQVDKVDVTSATIPNVDMHLNMLRGAITSMGGSVDVLEIASGVCKLKYKVWKNSVEHLNHN